MVDPELAEGEEVFRDKCGVVGIAARERVAPLIFYGLHALQHRGQESAGMSVFDGATRTHKAMGLVDQGFTPQVVEGLPGHVGIGHVRYSTTGSSVIENAQPVVVESQVGTLALAHNGDVVNSATLRDDLKAKGWAFLTTNDTEVAVRLLAQELTQTDNRVRAIRNVMRHLTGSYCFVILLGDTVYAVRDPLAIKPLCYGELPDGKGFIVASESTALNVIDAKLVRDVMPGEILEITADGVRSHPMLRLNEVRGGLDAGRVDVAHCMFEYVYFARADSVIDTKSVHEVRDRIGLRLAKEAPVDADVVVPVPDSGRTHALGFARGAGIPFAEGLMKNRYVGRTFIMPSQVARDVGVKMKLNPVRSVVDGRRVVLVDDSIVRGTTMKRIVQMLRDAGAKEVHVRIGSPPIKSPCYLGIDMNTRKQLVAANHTVDEIAKLLGADSLAYISVEGLQDAIGHEPRDLCTGCLTGVYPVEVPGEKSRKQATLF
ncbi:MAG TPA: amidophosphoribosyltransferase [Candidatus Thermoplasmatota archaeon]|nr:amidophosphoribosyltransferase [Candidatus Thermoplasmatota archaeon]